MGYVYARRFAFAFGKERVRYLVVRSLILPYGALDLDSCVSMKFQTSDRTCDGVIQYNSKLNEGDCILHEGKGASHVAS